MIDQPKIETLVWASATVLFIALGSVLVAQVARWIAGRFRLSESERRKIFWGFLFASPWIIGFVIFVVGPSLASLYYSFTEYKLGKTPEWIGLENYRQLIEATGRDGRNFRSAMYNSLYYAVVGVPLQVTAALAMALLLNTALRGMRAFRLIYYLPVILAGGPAILLAWRYMFSANGGFVNESLSGLAQSFFLFDWLYKGFIFVVEGFNGFFIGITKGDPTGPLNFFLPALVGTLLTILLLRGMWDPNKQRTTAQRFGEIITFGIGSIILAIGLVAEVVDITWIFVLTLAALVMIVVNVRQGKLRTANLWQIGTLIVLAGVFVFTLLATPDEAAVDLKSGYLVALAACIGALALTFVSRWDRRKMTLVGVLIAVLLGAVLLRLVPGQFGDGHAAVLVKYLTFQSAIENPADLDYLQTGFGQGYMDSVWLFGAVVLVAVGAMALHDRPRAQRYVLIAALVFFALIAINSAVDGVRYFNDFQSASDANGVPTYHFARFREATSIWPDDSHNPKWLNSDLWVKPSLILINIWSAGAGMLIFLAALKGVPKSLYEAATVDGANRVQRFFKITLPMISPAMFYNVVIGMIAALQTFEAVYILRTTDTETSVMSAAFYLYRRTFEQANIGEGAAMSWVLALIIVGLTIFQFRYSNWVNYEV